MHTSIVINNYPDSILISQSRRKKYYTKDKKIPKRYQSHFYNFDKDGKLYDVRTNQLVIANPRTAGTQRFWKVNFQDIWNGVLSGPNRAFRINKLKDLLRPHIQTIPRLTIFPIGLSITLYNSHFEIDASNKGAIYTKVIEDLLVETKKIPDDNPSYITDTGRIQLIKIEDHETPRMIINIFTISSNI